MAVTEGASDDPAGPDNSLTEPITIGEVSVAAHTDVALTGTFDDMDEVGADAAASLVFVDVGLETVPPAFPRGAWLVAVPPPPTSGLFDDVLL